MFAKTYLQLNAHATFLLDFYAKKGAITSIWPVRNRNGSKPCVAAGWWKDGRS